MTITDIASRTYNHGWRLDPIVRSLLDTDFYKLLMLQMIREFYPNQKVTFSVINRTRRVRLGDVIDEGELRARRAVRPRQGQAVGQGRAAAEARGLAAVRLRHAAAAWLPVAALVRRGRQGRAGLVLHRHLERAARDGQ